MQVWMEIDVVALQELIETMPWRVCAVIKAKGAPKKYEVFCLFLFFGWAV